MASNNKEELLQEEQSTRLDVQSSDAKEQCSICLAPLLERSTTNKCRECTKKINAVPTGFQFVIAGQERKEFECPICLCIIRDATELGCEHIMCGKCLERYEHDQIVKTKGNGEEKDAIFYCSICQEPYLPEKKTPVKSLDRIIQTTIPVKCEQKGCEWIGCIIDYKIHKEKCEFVSIQCVYFDVGCNAKVIRGNLEAHGQTNSMFHQTLLLNVVKTYWKDREELHKEMNNQKGLIQDLQEKVGILENENMIIQKEMARESQNNAENVQRLDKIAKENVDLTTEVDEQNKLIQDLNTKQANLENDFHIREEVLTEKIKAIETEKSDKDQEKSEVVSTLHSKLEKLEKVKINEIGSKIKSINRRMETLVESEKLQAKDIRSLEWFADKVSRLHNVLGSGHCFGANCQAYLGEVLYRSNKTVKEFNSIVEDLSGGDIGHDRPYLKKFTEAMKLYQEKFFSKMYKNRLNMFASMPIGTLHGSFVKLEVFNCQYITVIVTDTFERFNELTKDWCRNSNSIAINIDENERCLNVVINLTNLLLNSVRLLHKSDEQQIINLLTNGEKFPLELSDHVFFCWPRNYLMLECFFDLKFNASTT